MTQNTVTDIEVPCARGRWRLAEPNEKLRLRGALPGAFSYDRTAHSLRQAHHMGVPLVALLAPAMSGSWMVNNKAPSTVLKRWLGPDMRLEWNALLHALADGPRAWMDANEARREEVTEAVATLSDGSHRACAVSKVLALLCPDTVPLMDDAALWLMTGACAMPDDADHPSAGAEAFVPMLDAFCVAVIETERSLSALAEEYDIAVLSPAQTLDRLLWFDSWGHRIVTPKRWTLETTESSVCVR